MNLHSGLSKLTQVFMACSIIALGASPARASEQDMYFDGSTRELNASLTSELSHIKYKPVVIPATCYESVVVGYETKCHTEYQDVCHTEYQQECHTTYHDECSTTWHQECHTEYEHVCQTHYSQQCHTVHQCNNLPPPQQTCWDKEVCEQIPSTVCSDRPVEKCQNVPTQQCHSVPSQECHNEPHQVCTPQPHQVCEQEPVYESRPYDCSTTEQVPDGTELDFRVQGDVTLKFLNLATPLLLRETFTASMEGEVCTLALKDSVGDALFLIRNRAQNSAITKPDNGPASPGEKRLTASIELDALKQSDVLAPTAAIPTDLAIDRARNTLSFVVGKVGAPELFGGQLDLTRMQGESMAKTLLDRAPFAAVVYTVVAVDAARSRVVIDLAKMSLKEPLRAGTQYQVKVVTQLKLDTSKVVARTPLTADQLTKTLRTKVSTP